MSTKKRLPAPKRQRILEADITSIALCRQGKNQLPVLYKAQDGEKKFASLSKANELGELLNVVYAPDRDDLDGDSASRETIKRFAHRFNRDYRAIDIEHDGRVLDKSQAFVAESFIVAPGDERFLDWKDYEGNPVGDLTGAWATLIQIDDPILRKAAKKGLINGISMSGPSLVEELAMKSDDDTDNEPEEILMTPEQEASLARTIVAGVTTAFTELRKSEKAEQAAAEKAAADTKAVELQKSQAIVGERPIPKDVSTPEARAAYLQQLRAYELKKAIADGASIDTITELFKGLDIDEPADKDAGIKATDSPELRKAKRQVFMLEKRSTQIAKSEDAPENEEAQCLALGDAIAAQANSSRGYRAPIKV